MREQQQAYVSAAAAAAAAASPKAAALLSSPLLWTLVDASVPGRFHGVNLKAVRFLPSSLQ